MQSYNGVDGVAFHFHSSLEYVIVEDDEETEIRTEDMRGFLDYLRDADLDESLPYGGVYQGVNGTIFQFNPRISQVTIEDTEGRRVTSKCFRGFAAYIRGRQLEVALQDSGLDGVLDGC